MDLIAEDAHVGEPASFHTGKAFLPVVNAPIMRELRIKAPARVSRLLPQPAI
ncbi:hypothetical protein [Qipengyuania sp.]|uniref:hypothetical protein n=1 Tax=Qipengyuania sp. TaxID=2004515 RepID=UPI0035C8620F